MLLPHAGISFSREVMPPPDETLCLHGYCISSASAISVSAIDGDEEVRNLEAWRQQAKEHTIDQS